MCHDFVLCVLWWYCIKQILHKHIKLYFNKELFRKARKSYTTIHYHMYKSVQICTWFLLYDLEYILLLNCLNELWSCISSFSSFDSLISHHNIKTWVNYYFSYVAVSMCIYLWSYVHTSFCILLFSVMIDNIILRFMIWNVILYFCIL